jgi:hypothetical protein
VGAAEIRQVEALELQAQADMRDRLECDAQPSESRE